jgi:hypothetical protein
MPQNGQEYGLHSAPAVRDPCLCDVLTEGTHCEALRPERRRQPVGVNLPPASAGLRGALGALR